MKISHTLPICGAAAAREKIAVWIKGGERGDWKPSELWKNAAKAGKLGCKGGKRNVADPSPQR